jgi:hypothetical protein
MIIAIDETGDFNPDSELHSFFVAILIDQSNNGLEIKKEQFDHWKKTIPEQKFNEKGEVKGSDLDDNELLSFVKNVYNPDPVLRQEVVFFLPKENPESLMKIFKEIEVEKLNKVKELARDQGKLEMAKQYELMAIWHKNAKKMHYPHFFKLILLRSLISRAFNTCVEVSILLEMLHDKESQNLLNIKIKIDQDFVRGDDPKIYWKELLRNSFISSTIENPVPLLETWKNGHPFIEKYKHNSDDSLNFKDLFKNNCDFLESHEHFEIQLADITGIIINRFHNRNKAVDAYNELHRVIKKQKLTKLVLKNEPNFDINPIVFE